MLLNRLKMFFDAGEPAETAEPGAKQAVAALLIHASRIDGDIDPAEVAARDRLLQQKFDLPEGEIAELVMEAESVESDATDLFRFTQAIKDTYEREHRGHIVEMLWEIVLADGVIDEHEAHLVWRVAGLLGFGTRENGDFRRNVQARLASVAD